MKIKFLLNAFIGACLLAAFGAVKTLPAAAQSVSKFRVTGSNGAIVRRNPKSNAARIGKAQRGDILATWDKGRCWRGWCPVLLKRNRGYVAARLVQSARRGSSSPTTNTIDRTDKSTITRFRVTGPRGANIRNRADQRATIVGRLKRGKTIRAWDKGRCWNGWCPVRHNGENAYASTKVVSAASAVGSFSSRQPPTLDSELQVQTAGGRLTVRKTPGGNKIGSLRDRQYVDAGRCSKGWCPIRMPNGRRGWVSERFSYIVR